MEKTVKGGLLMFFGVYDLVEWLYFLIPLAAVAFFIVSMVRWLQAKDAPPGTFSPEQLHTRKILFRLSAVVVGVLAAVIIGFFLLLMTAVAFM